MTNRTLSNVPDNICFTLGFKPSTAAYKIAKTLSGIDKRCSTTLAYPSYYDIEYTLDNKLQPLWDAAPSNRAEAEYKMRFALAMMACKALRIFASTGNHPAAGVCVELAQIVKTRRVIANESRLKMAPEEIAIANDVCGVIVAASRIIAILKSGAKESIDLKVVDSADMAHTYRLADYFLAWVSAGAYTAQWSPPQ